MEEIRTAIVTGAASGIGERLCEELAEDGTIVYAADIEPVSLRHKNISAVELDVRDSEAWEKLVASVLREEGHLDLLANVAGVIRPGWSWDQAEEDVDFHLDINVKGVIHGCRAVVGPMMDQRNGIIINVASLAGITPVPGMSLYSASKFAVRGYSLSIAHELDAYGIHVGTICPDAVQTPMLDSEVDYEEAALTFSGSSPLSTDDVVRAIRDRLIEGRCTLVALPTSRGMLAHLSGMAPGATKRLLPIMRARGRRAQKKRSE